MNMRTTPTAAGTTVGLLAKAREGSRAANLSKEDCRITRRSEEGEGGIAP